MMENSGAIQTFVNTEFGNIRMLKPRHAALNDTLTGKILFCGKDVAEALGYDQPHKAIERHCRYGMKCTVPHPQSLDKEIEMTFIPEGDVYRLIVRSNFPTAKKFERWVFDEVLPSIRETGGYILSSPDDSDADIILRGYTAAMSAIEHKDREIEALQAHAKEAAPFTELGRAVAVPDGYKLISEAAVIMAQAGCEFSVAETGERRLIGVQYLRIYLEQKKCIVKRGRADAGRPTAKGMKYKLRIKASRLPNGDAVCSPILPMAFISLLIVMFRKKEMVLPKIVKTGYKTKETIRWPPEQS